MFNTIIEAFKGVMPNIIVALAVYGASLGALFLVSLKVNLFELKQAFEPKRFLNGLAEIVFSILSVFMYSFAAVGFIEVIDMSGVLREGLADQVSVAALLVIIGVAIYKNLLQYQIRAKVKLNVTDADIAEASEIPESVSGVEAADTQG